MNLGPIELRVAVRVAELGPIVISLELSQTVENDREKISFGPVAHLLSLSRAWDGSKQCQNSRKLTGQRTDCSDSPLTA